MNKSKLILLSDNLTFSDFGSQRYMGAYAIASLAEQAGYSTTVIDYFTRIENFFAYLEKFLSADTLVVGISSTFLFPSRPKDNVRTHRTRGLDCYYKGELWFDEGRDLKNWLLELKSLMKKHSPKARLVLGGVKAQFALWRAEYYSPVDHVVFGAGDTAILDILRAVEEGRQPKEVAIQGFKIIDNLAAKESDKQCPVTRYLPRWAIQKGESLPIELSRGCAFNCKFCHYEKKQSFRKDVEQLRQELLYNYEQFNTTTFHFCDDCFNDHRLKVEELCHMFMSLPFKMEWVAYARVDVAVRFPETIDLMVKSGAKGLYWGLESFDAEAARRAGKGTPPEAVKKFLIDFHERYGDRCISEGSFIVGLPGETQDSLLRTMDWLSKNQVLDLVTWGSLGLMPYTSSLDKVVVDYADYSRNPQKYGFKKVTFRPNYWEHETMNSTTADQLANSLSSQWRAEKKPGFLRSIWLYPHLRTLGFQESEILRGALDAGQTEFFVSEVKLRFQKHLTRYFEHLVSFTQEVPRDTRSSALDRAAQHIL